MDSDAVRWLRRLLARAAHVVRNETLKVKSSFGGTFPLQCYLRRKKP